MLYQKVWRVSYIGGVALARGYLNRDDLTESTFIPNPFWDGKDRLARLYKTGDLVHRTTGDAN